MSSEFLVGIIVFLCSSMVAALVWIWKRFVGRIDDHESRLKKVETSYVDRAELKEDFKEVNDKIDCVRGEIKTGLQRIEDKMK